MSVVVRVGFGIVWGWLLFKTKQRLIEIGRNFAMLWTAGYVVLVFLNITSFVSFQHKVPQFVLVNLVGLACTGTFVYLIRETLKMGREWIAALLCGAGWLAGAAFYLYMPLASMSNPPLNWG